MNITNTETSMKPKRSVCRYHGGKWLLADWIISHFPPHRYYVELFGGSGSVLMKKYRSACELYNDLDGEVVNYFRVLRDPEKAARLKHMLELTPYARDELMSAFHDPPSSEPVERARRFFINLSMAMGGKMQCKTRGFRTRRGDDTSTPATDFVNYPRHIKSFTERLKDVVIENRPAVDVINRHNDPDTLFYCDPPYLHELRTMKGRETYRHEMTEADHVELAEKLNAISGYAIVSGYPSELYKDLYQDKGWKVCQRPHRAESGRETMECLWLSPRTAEALARKTLF